MAPGRWCAGETHNGRYGTRLGGDYSVDMWDAINALSATSTCDDVRDVLYLICCRLQSADSRVKPNPMATAWLDRALEEIDGMIKRGPLQGNGCDETAERNGLILAYNAISYMRSTGRSIREISEIESKSNDPPAREP